jgi:hypothetical protein
MTKPASTPILAAITTLPVIVAFFAFAAPAVAEPITYTVQGTASGTLDDIPFTSYTISLAGDTNNIVQPNPSVPNFVNPFAPGTATVTVTGKTDTLPDVFAFVNGRNPPLGPLTGYAGFSFGQGGFITQTISTAFDSYKLGAIGSTPGDTFTSFTSSGLGGLTTGSGGTFTFTNTGVRWVPPHLTPTSFRSPLHFRCSPPASARWVCSAGAGSGRREPSPEQKTVRRT